MARLTLVGYAVRVDYLDSRTSLERSIDYYYPTLPQASAEAADNVPGRVRARVVPVYQTT